MKSKILLSIILLSIIGCNDSTPEPIKKHLSEDIKFQVHEALGRSLRIDQSCYDPIADIWLVHAREKPEGSTSTWEQGWYYQDSDKLKVLKLGNNTMSLLNINEIFNTMIFPDISNLECKQHLEYQHK